MSLSTMKRLRDKGMLNRWMITEPVFEPSDPAKDFSLAIILTS
jgi:hypothetical protein